MRFAETNPSIEKKWIERHCVAWADAGFGNAAGGGMGEFVRLADHEVFEDEAVVQRQILRLVIADIVGAGQFQGWGHFRLFAAGGMTRSVGVLRSPADNYRDAGHQVVFHPPKRQQAIGVVGGYPIAQKTRRRSDCCLAVIDALQVDRLKPITECLVADLNLKVRDYPRPFALPCADHAVAIPLPTCFSHHSIPQEFGQQHARLSSPAKICPSRRPALVLLC